MPDHLGLKDIKYIPISALKGDNIVEKSEKFPWYEGESLLHYLENIQLDSDINLTDARFSVQYVIRPQAEDLTITAAMQVRLSVAFTEKVIKLLFCLQALKAPLKQLKLDGKEIEEAYALQSVVLHLEDDVDVSRGDMIVQL